MKSKFISKRIKPIYGNCRVIHPDGHLMFLCLEKRAKWYLDRNLAETISTDPLTIRLTFEPKGKGNDDIYYLSQKKNACVICGEEDLILLTKHHVVPSEYRRSFPDDRKSRSSHDIVVVCTDDHYDYENNHAQKLKRQLEKEYGIERSKLSHDFLRTRKAYNFAQIMLDMERIMKIPKSRTDFFRKEMMELFGTDNPVEVTKINVHKKIDKEDQEIGKKIVEKIEDIDAFCVMWRHHFVDCMKPKFLPTGWKIDHKE